jgi:hypothetical protein
MHRQALATIGRSRDENVRFGSKADMCVATSDVRFTPESGHVRCSYGCPLWAKSGHIRPKMYPSYSAAGV